jgi:hypothetical protein
MRVRVLFRNKMRKEGDDSPFFEKAEVYFQARSAKLAHKQFHLLNFPVKIVHLNHFHLAHTYTNHTCLSPETHTKHCSSPCCSHIGHIVSFRWMESGMEGYSSNDLVALWKVLLHMKQLFVKTLMKSSS